MPKPIITVRHGYHEPKLYDYVGGKVRIAYRDGRKRRIKLCSVYYKFNCECCGSQVVAETSTGEIVARACGGYIPYPSY